eukprot:1843322-Alexandrium_andersonii.AAC.1
MCIRDSPTYVPALLATAELQGVLSSRSKSTLQAVQLLRGLGAPDQGLLQIRRGPRLEAPPERGL